LAANQPFRRAKELLLWADNKKKAISDPTPLTIETIVLFTHPPSAGPTEKAGLEVDHPTARNTAQVASLSAFQER